MDFLGERHSHNTEVPSASRGDSGGIDEGRVDLESNIMGFYFIIIWKKTEKRSLPA